MTARRFALLAGFLLCVATDAGAAMRDADAWGDLLQGFQPKPGRACIPGALPASIVRGGVPGKAVASATRGGRRLSPALLAPGAPPVTIQHQPPRRAAEGKNDEKEER